MYLKGSPDSSISKALRRIKPVKLIRAVSHQHFQHPVHAHIRNLGTGSAFLFQLCIRNLKFGGRSVSCCHLLHPSLQTAVHGPVNSSETLFAIIGIQGDPILAVHGLFHITGKKIFIGGQFLRHRFLQCACLQFIFCVSWFLSFCWHFQFR